MTNYKLFKTAEEMLEFKRNHGGHIVDLSKKENQDLYRMYVDVYDFDTWKYSVEWNWCDK